MEVELLVLANSIKLGGRCLAGIDIATGKWIRPVGDNLGAQLDNRLTIFDGIYLRPGDLIRISLSEHFPHKHHPENFILAGTKIDLVARNQLLNFRVLVSCTLKNETNLNSRSIDHITAEEVAQGFVDSSLCLIGVTDIHFYQVSYYGKITYRVKFNYEDEIWDLVNTDDKGNWNGDFASGLICVSLAEFFPSKNAHYKLASGFIPIDVELFNTAENYTRSMQLSTLPTLVKEVLGIQLPIDDDERLQLKDWFFQSQVQVNCLYCEAQSLNIFRTHVVGTRENVEKVLHRFGIACIQCKRVYSTPLDNESFRKTLRDATEKVAKVKTLCPNCSFV